jgi:hypothetical protein
LTACNQHTLLQRPYRDKIILSSGDDIAAIGRPTDAHHPAVIAHVVVEQLLVKEIHNSKGPILGHDGKMTSVGRELESIDLGPGDLPVGHGVRSLVLRIDRLFDRQQSFQFLLPIG